MASSSFISSPSNSTYKLLWRFLLLVNEGLPNSVNTIPDIFKADITLR